MRRAVVITSCLLLVAAFLVLMVGPYVARVREDQVICEIRGYHWTWITRTCSEYDLWGDR